MTANCVLTKEANVLKNNSKLNCIGPIFSVKVQNFLSTRHKGLMLKIHTFVTTMLK